MDANKDGKLAKAEVQGRLKDNFDKADTNGDGFITEEEFKNMAPPKRGQR
jgi:Ca2+-binding EF-hand superfamily protein